MLHPLCPASLTPPIPPACCARGQMGWSSWNAFHGSINEAVITNVTEALIATGLRDVGFVYVNLDE